jgi:hypothetical protein
LDANAHANNLLNTKTDVAALFFGATSCTTWMFQILAINALIFRLLVHTPNNISQKIECIYIAQQLFQLNTESKLRITS